MILYDTPADIVAKALRGLGERPETIAGRAGVSTARLADFLKGAFDAETARRIAPALGLDPDALANHGEPFPLPDLPAGIHRLELPFEDETVNAWSLETGDPPIVVDAGSGRRDLAGALPDGGFLDLLITHPHRDHVGGLGALRDRIRELWCPTSLRGATVVHPRERRELSGHAVEILDLAGHHPDAVGYRIAGYGVPVLAVGDAIFARSAGGCPGPAAYHRARTTLVDALRDQPDETVILTGHGAPTTLGTEREQNPFLRAWLGVGA